MGMVRRVARRTGRRAARRTTRRNVVGLGLLTAAGAGIYAMGRRHGANSTQQQYAQPPVQQAPQPEGSQAYAEPEMQA